MDARIFVWVEGENFSPRDFQSVVAGEGTCFGPSKSCTRGGAREFVLPNGQVRDLTGVTRRIVE